MDYLFGGVVNIHDPGKLGVSKNTVLEQVAADNTEISARFGARRRLGRIQRVSGAAHSGFNTIDGSVALFVQSGVLKSLNADHTTTNIKTLTSDNRMSYEEINNVIACSNGIDRGIIEGGAWYDYASPTKRFKKPFPASNHLTFHYSRMYGALGSVLTWSDPNNLESVDQRLSKAPVDGAVRMLQAVDGGIWLSTSRQIFFIRGKDHTDFENIPRANYPAIPYAYTLAFGEKITGLELTGKVVVFGTEQGVCIGTSDGQLINLSKEKVSFNTGLDGSIIVRERDGQTHIVLSLDTSRAAHNPYGEQVSSGQDGGPSLDFSLASNSQYIGMVA